MTKIHHGLYRHYHVDTKAVVCVSKPCAEGTFQSVKMDLFKSTMCIVNMLSSTECKVVVKSTLYFSSTWHQKVHALSLSPLETEAKTKGAFAVQVHSPSVFDVLSFFPATNTSFYL